MTKRIRYYEYKVVDGRTHKQLGGEADFHEFGVDFDEFDAGPGNYSIAIVELDTGKVVKMDLENIEFIKEI